MAPQSRAAEGFGAHGTQMDASAFSWPVGELTMRVGAGPHAGGAIFLHPQWVLATQVRTYPAQGRRV